MPGPPNPLVSDAPSNAPSPPERPPAHADGRRTLGRLPANLGRGFIGVFDKDNLVPLLIGGAASGGAALLDDSVREHAANPDSSFGKWLETEGAWVSSIAVGGLFAAGRFAEGQRFRDTTYDMADALLVNIGYTELLKAAVGRERPDGENHRSFPSGHTSNAFTVATVLERHYGWKAGVPAYAVAATMGYSRIVRDKHWLSDVVAGASLGYIVGRTVVRVNGKPLPQAGPRTAWTVSPVVGRRTRGVQVSLSF